MKTLHLIDSRSTRRVNPWLILLGPCMLIFCGSAICQEGLPSAWWEEEVQRGKQEILDFRSEIDDLKRDLKGVRETHDAALKLGLAAIRYATGREQLILDGISYAEAVLKYHLSWLEYAERELAKLKGSPAASQNTDVEARRKRLEELKEQLKLCKKFAADYTDQLNRVATANSERREAGTLTQPETDWAEKPRSVVISQNRRCRELEEEVAQRQR